MPLVMATIWFVDRIPLDRHRVRSGREHTVAFPNNGFANRFANCLANRCGVSIVDRDARGNDAFAEARPCRAPLRSRRSPRVLG